MFKYKWIDIKTKMLEVIPYKFSEVGGAKLKKRNQMMGMKVLSIVTENRHVFFRLRSRICMDDQIYFFSFLTSFLLLPRCRLRLLTGHFFTPPSH